MKKLFAYLIIALLGGIAAIGVYKLLEPDPVPETVVLPSNPGKQVRYLSTKDPEVPTFDFTYAAESTLPSVVHIRSSQKVTRRAYDERDFDWQQIPESFRDFFRNSPFFSPPDNRMLPEDQLRLGAGSGVIISPDGYIVTNNHVVANADELTVTLQDHRTFEAAVIGSDPSTDVALVKIEATELKAIPFFDSDNIKIGAWVVAVGNPFNLGSTVTAGIVSAKSRSINISQDQRPIESFIQTDAAINRGNSGGALVNLSGELVGINTAISSPTGTYTGYGFAVPSNIVRKVATDLQEYGVVQRGFIGAVIRGIDGDLAEEKGLSTTMGVYVDSLTANSAAASAGIEVGDVITAVDDMPTDNVPKVLEMVGRHRPGDKVKINILRKDKPQEIWVTLRNRAGNTDLVKKEETTGILQILGADLETVNQADAETLSIPGGIRVQSLGDGKLRKQTDIQEGFIITKVDGKRVTSVEELANLLKGLKGGVLLEGVYPDSSEVFYYAIGMDD